ncbi:hypothetical protein [Haloferula sargassicola]
MRFLHFLTPFLAILTLQAEPRIWKSADSDATFEGELITQNDTEVTIRRTDGKEFTVAKTRLHPDDRAWIAAQAEPDLPPPGATFDTLRFGDDRDQVRAKLLKSRLVEPTVDATFLARIGLNGAFRTREKVGGLSCLLFFDWDGKGKLSEIILQTEDCGAGTYAGKLHETWQEMIALLTELHGEPLQGADYPKMADLGDGAFLGSHLWRLKSGGSALLGTSRDGEAYHAGIRFTAEEIEPVRTP